MTLAIRPATLADCAALARIQVDSYEQAYVGLLPAAYLAQFSYAEQESDWHRWLGEHTADSLLVATHADAPVGYALARPWQANVDGYDAEVAALHVQRAWQRQGIGRALLAASAQALCTLGCRSLTLTTLAGNPTRAWYERLGGIELGPLVWDLDGVTVKEIIYGWPDLSGCLSPRQPFVSAGRERHAAGNHFPPAN